MELNTDPGYLIEIATIYGLKVLGALAIFLLGKWAAKGLARLCRRMMERGKVDETLVSFGGNVIYALLLAVVVIAALGNLGIQTMSLAAILAAAGLAIGLAFQGSLGNLASGVMLIIFRPFKLGDYIDAAGVSGTVEEINIFTTNLKTPDNKLIILPNGAITGDAITNYSANETRRIDFVFGCSYEDDLKKVKRVLGEVIANDSRILKEPEPVIAVSELADNSVNLVVRPWVRREDYWDVFFAITETVKNRFEDENISIPYPQQTIHVHSNNYENAIK